MDQVFAIALGYVAGSIPFAYLLTRRRGIDLRRVGSGNVGAANALRATGVGTAVLAMCLDGLKGAVAVVIAQRLAGGVGTAVAAGLASVIGHIYPVWLGFRGGKGVATAAGVFAVLAPMALAAAGVVFVLAVSITRYISVGSLLGTAALAAATAISGAHLSVLIGALATAVLIVQRHRGNLARLRAGTERRVGQRLT